MTDNISAFFYFTSYNTKNVYNTTLYLTFDKVYIAYVIQAIVVNLLTPY